MNFLNIYNLGQLVSLGGFEGINRWFFNTSLLGGKTYGLIGQKLVSITYEGITVEVGDIGDDEGRVVSFDYIANPEKLTIHTEGHVYVYEDGHLDIDPD